MQLVGIKIPFFRVSVTIEPGRSFLQFVTSYLRLNNQYSNQTVRGICKKKKKK